MGKFIELSKTLLWAFCSSQKVLKISAMATKILKKVIFESLVWS